MYQEEKQSSPLMIRIPITDVSTTYRAILEYIEIINIPTRRQSKEKIADNISDVQFSQPRKQQTRIIVLQNY